MKKFALFATLFVLFNTSLSFASDQFGGPSRVRCQAEVLVAKQPIRPGTNINDLIENQDGPIRLFDQVFECRKFNGKVVGCEAMVTHERVYLRYTFNSQSGTMEIKDNVTGQSLWDSWLNQHKLTGSGYVSKTLWMSNSNGGLLGFPRAFQVEFSCYASKKDW